MASLDRETVVPLVLAVLALLALVLASATLDSLVVEAGTGQGEGSGQARPPVDRTGDNVSLGYVSNGTTGAQTGTSSIDVSFCIPFLTTPLGTLLFFGAGGLALYGIYRRHGAAALGLFGLGVGPPAGIIYLFFTRACSGGSGFQPAAVNSTAQGSAGASGGGLQALQVPPSVLIAAFGVVLVGAVALLLFTTTGDEAVEPPERDEEVAEETDLEEVARVAGEAAERIEEGQADLDNEVYRAWREMTDLLDVARPETSTPGEFAAAAIEAGMNREDVAELTRLFNEVRYGEMDPEPREELALETLQNIEAEYGVDEPEGEEA